VDLYNSLKEYNLNIKVFDPWADYKVVKEHYGIELESILPEEKFDAVILAVAHDQFKTMDIHSLVKDTHIICDIKGVLPKDMVDGRL
jgi:UDP-N-acetyl-D-galactosamine dehydrogenase